LDANLSRTRKDPGEQHQGQAADGEGDDEPSCQQHARDCGDRGAWKRWRRPRPELQRPVGSVGRRCPVADPNLRVGLLDSDTIPQAAVQVTDRQHAAGGPDIRTRATKRVAERAGNYTDDHHRMATEIRAASDNAWISAEARPEPFADDDRRCQALAIVCSRQQPSSRGTPSEHTEIGSGHGIEND
jgi:hypothetical protein